MSKDSSSYHCPNCGNTAIVFIHVLSVRGCRCGRHMRLSKALLQPTRLEATATSMGVEGKLV